MSKTPMKMALLVLLVLLFQGTWALAGTTGGVSGYVLEQNGTPIAAATVTATAPTATETAHSDASGHFVFISLTPDTYTLTASKEGFDTVSQAGITVIADNTQTVTLHTQRTAKVIAIIPVRAANELVRPGTTADVYSVNAAQSAKLGNLGGGGGADNVYGALASMPGAFVPPGQYGWYQTIIIRGGNFDQVGYEYDGVPVNRSFDNYPSSTASNVGQNEVQLYTGAAPQNAEGQGLAGFINQVIKNGTYPGWGTIDAAIGGPSLYNKVNFEIGGSTPSRNFTYYIATGGYNVRPRPIDNSNGAGTPSKLFGAPFDAYAGGDANTLGCPFSGTSPNAGIAPGGGTGDSCTSNYQIFQDNFNTGNNFTFLGGGPAGYVIGPIQNAPYVFQVADRENVINLHFGLPHRSDSGKDDVQFLYSNSLLKTPYYMSNLDWGINPFFTNTHATPVTYQIGSGTTCTVQPGANTAACGAVNPDYFGLASPTQYNSGYQVTTPAGTVFTSACAAPCGVFRYAYPSSGVQCVDLSRFCNTLGVAPGFFPPAAANLRDSSENGQGIYKLQYQHNIGSTAYFRVYAYSYYSWWYLYGPHSLNTAFVGCCPSDYELSTHTRGASAQFQDQLNAKNLFTAQIAGITATTVRDNNTQMLTYASGSRRRAFVLVDAANPYNGLCYTTGGTYGSCQPDSVAVSGRATYRAYFQVGCGDNGLNGCGVSASGLPAPGSTCGANFASPCAWLQAESGPYATFNNVKPTFWSGSIGDQWKPSDKLLLNLGLRFDSFSFKGGVTDHGNISSFWFNAWNSGFCISGVPGSSPVDKMEDLATYFTPLAGGPITPLTPCTSISDPTNPGKNYLPATLSNVSAPQLSYTEWQPRLGGTFTASPDDVIRFSVGKYAQAPNAAFEQYNTLQQNTAAFLGRRFSAYGFSTPGHQVPPSESWNSDLSWEHRFANSDTSIKLSPFYRETKNEYQLFFLDQKTAFVSGLPVGKKTAEGVEFELTKGDFSRNGLSGILAYTYTWATVKYGKLPGNGGTVLTSINNAIKTYNGYTSFCAANPSDPRCGMPTNLKTATPCYSVFTGVGGSGLPAPGCAAGTIANPYWNAPVQPLMDPGAPYTAFATFPNGFNSAVAGYEIPNVASLVLNWKHDKFSITPQVQYFGEGFYGAPLQSPGIDPASNNIPGNNQWATTALGSGGGCGGALGTPIAGDPRYPYGAPAGSPYDAITCHTNIFIPNPYTGRFDGIGAFRTPQQLLGHLLITFEASPRITYTASFTNLVDTCWGGSKQPWTTQPGVDHRVCGYGLPGYAPVPSVGNFYNPDSQFQALVKYPYLPAFGVGPVGASFGIKMRL